MPTHKDNSMAENAAGDSARCRCRKEFSNRVGCFNPKCPDRHLTPDEQIEKFKRLYRSWEQVGPHELIVKNEWWDGSVSYERCVANPLSVGRPTLIRVKYIPPTCKEDQ